MTLADVTEETGISAPTLSRIERQMYTPDLSTYYQICKWLEVPLETFFERIAIAA